MNKYLVKRTDIRTIMIELTAENDAAALAKSKNGYGKGAGYPECQTRVEVLSKQELYERELFEDKI